MPVPQRMPVRYRHALRRLQREVSALAARSSAYRARLAIRAASPAPIVPVAAQLTPVGREDGSHGVLGGASPAEAPATMSASEASGALRSLRNELAALRKREREAPKKETNQDKKVKDKGKGEDENLCNKGTRTPTPATRPRRSWSAKPRSRLSARHRKRWTRHLAIRSAGRRWRLSILR